MNRLSVREKVIGYWKETEEDDYPIPIPVTATDQEVKQMLHHLDQFISKATVRAYKGSSKCRICGCSNGSEEYVVTKKGRRILIPEGLWHYIVHHRVKVDDLLVPIL